MFTKGCELNNEMILLRTLHIGFGVFWSGSAILMTFVIEPRLRTLGPELHRQVMGHLGQVTGPILGTSGLITFLSGIAMSLRLRWGNLDSWFDTGWGWAITIGFVVSVIPLIAGIMTGGVAKQIGVINATIRDRVPTDEELDQMGKMARQLQILARAATVLIIVGVGTMAAARFV